MTLDETTGLLEASFSYHSAPAHSAPQKEQWELEADAYEALGLVEKYLIDERRFQIFDGLYYCTERGEWLARMQSASGKNPPLDLPYLMVLRGFQIMADNWIKPSQSYRALKAFGAKLDLETAKLEFSHEP